MRRVVHIEKDRDDIELLFHRLIELSLPNLRFLLVCEVFGELESFSDTLAICQQSIEFDAKDEDKVEARLNQVIFFIMTF